MDNFLNDIAAENGNNNAGGGGSGSRKRRSDGWMGPSPDNHGDEKRSKLLYGGNCDSFAQFVGPIASFGVFGSLSNSSGEYPDGSGGGNNGTATQSSSSGTTKTTILSPRNRLSSFQRSPLPPSAPHLSDCDEAKITNEHSHPSKGTLEQYDNDLYNKLRDARSQPHDVKLPPLLAPQDEREGNRLIILRGSSRVHSDVKIED